MRRALGLVFDWNGRTRRCYGLLARGVDSIWENWDVAADGVATPEERCVLNRWSMRGLFRKYPYGRSADGAAARRRPITLTANLREASALLDEAGLGIAGDDRNGAEAGGDLSGMEMVHSRAVCCR